MPEPEIDTSVPHSARIWDYWLGGKDNYPVDREAGDAVLRVLPVIADSAKQDRAFLGRAVRFLVSQGIRQFLDLGTGLPTVDNTHEVAQRVAPESRIVYVDNDPLVLAHARALLTSRPEGACDYIQADIRDRRWSSPRRPAPRLRAPGRADAAGRAEPHPGRRRGAAARRGPAARPRAGQPPGHLAHLRRHDRRTGRRGDAPGGAGGDGARRDADPRAVPEEIAELFTGTRLLDPGVVSCSRWRPDPSPWREPEVPHFSGVAVL